MSEEVDLYASTVPPEGVDDPGHQEAEPQNDFNRQRSKVCGYSQAPCTHSPHKSTAAWPSPPYCGLQVCSIASALRHALHISLHGFYDDVGQGLVDTQCS